MKGSNTFVLNELTMMAALQHYFDNVVFSTLHGKPPKVMSITHFNTGRGSGNEFTICVDAEQEDRA